MAHDLGGYGRGGRRSTAARRGNPVTAIPSTDPRKQTAKAGKYVFPGESTDPRKQTAAAGRRVAAERPVIDFDPDSAIADLLASIDADYQDAIARLRGRGGGGGGGGGAGYADAIKEAEELLADVLGNRAALKSIYGDYEAVVDPLSDEAIAAAARIVAENQGAFGGIAAGEEAGIEGAYDTAEGVIAEMAALIGAQETAAPTQETATQMEAIELEAALQEAESAEKVLGLTQTAAQAEAQAARSLDEGQIERQAHLVDLEFEQMEESVRDQIKQLRQAAAAAASAARARRAAGASDLAALEEERFLALQINPHEAGEATALAYLRRNGGNLDYNRQQLVLSTMSNALSQQVTPGMLPRWLNDQGVRLQPAELNLVRGGINAYVAGMRHQQTRDRGTTATVPYGDSPSPRRPRGQRPTSSTTRPTGPQ